MAETNFNLEKQPRPEQFTGESSMGFDMGQFTPIQQEYLKTIGGRPNEQELYGQISKELKIPEQREIVSGLKRSILDLEGKIKAVEPNVGERTKDFFVTEAQRKRRVDVEEQPLREQYLESMRRLEGQQQALGSREQLLQQRMSYAGQEYDRYADLLSTAMQFQQDNKGGSLTNDEWLATIEDTIRNANRPDGTQPTGGEDLYDQQWQAATTLGGEQAGTAGVSAPSSETMDVLRGIKLSPEQLGDINKSTDFYGMRY